MLTFSVRFRRSAVRTVNRCNPGHRRYDLRLQAVAQDFEVVRMLLQACWKKSKTCPCE